MNNEIIETYSIHNGNIINNKNQNIPHDFPSEVVYEVIRVIDGIPLFLEEHSERLIKSSDMVGMDISDLIHKIESDVKKLIEINNKPYKNLKIIVFKDTSEKLNYYMYFIKSYYPEPELYKKGINTILFKASRKNPNAKVQNLQLREAINKELEKSGAYEALLLNEYDNITEGSKSNVFFIKNDILYTPPRQDILLGVTRTRILQLAGKLGIKIVEESIHKSFLNQCHGLFITGTSPKVLPISRVDSLVFDSANNEIIQRLMKAYDKLIEDYINTHK
ncbi:MAG TPA: aminotransferase class IV [Clostridiales bacterium]|nr:aminotransferase class IV [Clostridiales bacterium]